MKTALLVTFAVYAGFQNVETGKYSHPKMLGEFKSLKECTANAWRLAREYRDSFKNTDFHFRIIGTPTCGAI